MEFDGQESSRGEKDLRPEDVHTVGGSIVVSRGRASARRALGSLSYCIVHEPAPVRDTRVSR